MTGIDYLIAAAQSSVEAGVPFARPFAGMIEGAVVPERPVLLLDVIARRPLEEHEAGPASIVGTALRLAIQDGDGRSVREVTDVGLSLMAKWSCYLASTTDGHPTLQRRIALAD